MKKIQTLVFAGMLTFLAILIVNAAYANPNDPANKTAAESEVFLEREQGGNAVKTQALPSVFANNGSEGIVTSDLNTGLSPEALVNSLLGEGLEVSNVTFIGANSAAGTFGGGSEILGFEEGIILSTGNISYVIGPNEFDDISQVNGLPGDSELDTLIPNYSTFDATVLEFDFIPASNIIQFEYVFGSEEYNEYVNTQFNDVFGFFVNNENIALIPGTSTPVSINNVNNGNPFGDNSSNPAYYINNDLNDGGGLINTEMDGFTVVLTATANVTPGELSHIKLAIADAGDSFLDSNVILRAESFISPKLRLEPVSATNKLGEVHTLTATFVDEAGLPVAGETISFNVTEGPHAGLLGTNVTDSQGKAVLNYSGKAPGNDTIIATGGGQSSNKVTKIWVGGEVSKLTLEPLASTNLLGLLHTLKATLVDAEGKPVEGEMINFNVSAGPYAGTSGTALSDANGTAFWTYGISPGTDTIVASGGGQVSNEVSKVWEKAAGTRLSLEPLASENTVGNFHVLKATLLDEAGKPISGELMSFKVKEGPHKGISGSALSDSEGVASWCYFGLLPGEDTIVALGGAQASNKVSKTWTSSEAQLILEPKAATNFLGESHELTAMLVNGTGAPIAGKQVAFNVSSGPHTGVSGTGITDNKGIASWNYTGAVAGNDSIVATSGMLSSNKVFKSWESSPISESVSELRGDISKAFTQIRTQLPF